MSEELNVNPKEAVGQEAELAAENMAAGREKKPEVDVDQDYEASKQYSVSDIDKSEAGVQAASAATVPQREMPQPEKTRVVAEPTGNPEDYREMAKDVNPRK